MGVSSTLDERFPSAFDTAAAALWASTMLALLRVNSIGIFPSGFHLVALAFVKRLSARSHIS